jgi:hypothetical protein
VHQALASADIRALAAAVPVARLLPVSIPLLQRAEVLWGNARHRASENLTAARGQCLYYGTLAELGNRVELDRQGGDELRPWLWEALRELDAAATQADDAGVPVDVDVRRLLATTFLPDSPSDASEEAEFLEAVTSGDPAALEGQLAAALASRNPVALGDAVSDARQHQLDTPLLHQAEERLSVVQHQALVALAEARNRCSFPEGPGSAGEPLAPTEQERGALAALDAAAAWAFDVGVTVDTTIREPLLAAGYRW